MPDIFDRVAGKGGGDIFDRVAATITPAPKAPDRQPSFLDLVLQQTPVGQALKAIGPGLRPEDVEEAISVTRGVSPLLAERFVGPIQQVGEAASRPQRALRRAIGVEPPAPEDVGVGSARRAIRETGRAAGGLAEAAFAPFSVPFQFAVPPEVAEAVFGPPAEFIRTGLEDPFALSRITGTSAAEVPEVAGPIEFISGLAPFLPFGAARRGPTVAEQAARVRTFPAAEPRLEPRQLPGETLPEGLRTFIGPSERPLVTPPPAGTAVPAESFVRGVPAERPARVVRGLLTEGTPPESLGRQALRAGEPQLPPSGLVGLEGERIPFREAPRTGKPVSPREAAALETRFREGISRGARAEAAEPASILRESLGEEGVQQLRENLRGQVREAVRQEVRQAVAEETGVPFRPPEALEAARRPELSPEPRRAVTPPTEARPATEALQRPREDVSGRRQQLRERIGPLQEEAQELARQVERQKKKFGSTAIERRIGELNEQIDYIYRTEFPDLFEAARQETVRAGAALPTRAEAAERPVSELRTAAETPRAAETPTPRAPAPEVPFRPEFREVTPQERLGTLEAETAELNRRLARAKTPAERTEVEQRIRENQELVLELRPPRGPARPTAESGALPGLEQSISAQREGAGRVAGERLTEELARPLEERAGRPIEGSPLFRGTEAAPQREMFAGRPQTPQVPFREPLPEATRTKLADALKEDITELLRQPERNKTIDQLRDVSERIESAKERLRELGEEFPAEREAGIREQVRQAEAESVRLSKEFVAAARNLKGAREPVGKHTTAQTKKVTDPLSPTEKVVADSLFEEGLELGRGRFANTAPLREWPIREAQAVVSLVERGVLRVEEYQPPGGAKPRRRLVVDRDAFNRAEQATIVAEATQGSGSRKPAPFGSFERRIEDDVRAFQRIEDARAKSKRESGGERGFAAPEFFFGERGAKALERLGDKFRDRETAIAEENLRRKGIELRENSIGHFITPSGKGVAPTSPARGIMGHAEVAVDAGFIPESVASNNPIGAINGLLKKGWIRWTGGLGFSTWRLDQQRISLLNKRIGESPTRYGRNESIFLDENATGKAYRFTYGDYIDSGFDVGKAIRRAEKFEFQPRPAIDFSLSEKGFAAPEFLLGKRLTKALRGEEKPSATPERPLTPEELRRQRIAERGRLRVIEPARQPEALQAAAGTAAAPPDVPFRPPAPSGLGGGGEPPRPPTRPARDFAANINLEKLATGDEVLQAIRDTATRSAKEIETQRRGRISQEETARAAERLVEEGHITEDALSRMRKGKALNAEQAVAARSILVDSAERVAQSQRRAQEANTTENLLQFQAEVKRHAAIQKAVSGATAEAGRALNSYKIVVAALRSKQKTNLERVLDELGGRELTEEAMRKLAQIPENDTAGLNKFLREQSQFTTADKISAYWTANILSGPRTQIRNIIGNTVFGPFTQIPVRAVRGAVDVPISRLQGRAREFYVSEAGHALRGYVAGVPEGLKKAGYILRNGFDMADAAKLEMPRAFEFRGGARNPFNFPGRALLGMDALFRTMAFQAELYAQAARRTYQAGLRGKAASRRMTELVSNPPAEMVESAIKQSRYETFTSEPDVVSRTLLDVRNRVRVPEDVPLIGGLQPMRFIIPFINTPWNITKGAFKNSPLGLLELTRKSVRSTPEASTVTARAALGAGVMTGLAILASNGRLTGAAPTTPAERDSFFREGKQAFSIKVGNRWIAYNQSTGPLALLAASVAAFHDAFERDDEAPTTERIAEAAGVVGQAIIDQSFFQGLQNLFEAISDPERAASNLFGGITRGFVPFSGLQQNIAQALDPNIRDARGAYDRIRSGLPLLSKTLPARLDVLGREIERRGGSGLAAFLPSPIPEAGARGEVDRELSRLNIKPGFVGRKLTVGRKEVELTDDEKREYQRIAGERIRQNLEQLFANPAYQQAPLEAQKSATDRTVDAARRQARSEMVQKILGRRRQTPQVPFTAPNLAQEARP